MSQANESKHVVAVIGAAVAGSEAARVLAENGVEVVVFERNARPFGKIEDGLPIWHSAQRKVEYKRITDRLAIPGVHYVPNTSLGEQITIRGLIEEWGVSAVLLATGAWRDRMLPVPGIEAYVDKGLILQNSLVYWFNHHREADFAGPHHQMADDMAIVGGGLASIDVAKILMLETVHDALAERGIEVDILEMERKTIAAVLAEKGLSLADLGLKGCTLYYRRRKQDMPLAEMPRDATAERKAKVEHVRKKVVDLAMGKYLFRFQACTLPKTLIAEDDRLVGLQCARTVVENGKLVEQPGSEFDLRAPLFVSSIGSIPEPLPCVSQVGEYFHLADQDTGALAEFDNVFGLGNVVTGKGNIRVSRKHGASVSNHVFGEVLAQLEDHLACCAPLAAEQVAAIEGRAAERQAEVGYEGDLLSWIEQVSPSDML